MADRDSRVALDKKRRERSTDDIAAADDDCPAALDLDAVVVEQLDPALGRARAQGGEAHVHAPGVDRRDAIDVLERIEILIDQRLWQVGRQRHQHEDTGDRRVVAEPSNFAG